MGMNKSAHRPRILNTDQETFLEYRIFLSKELGIFTLVEIADGWEMSLATLHRYKSVAYRIASQEAGRKVYLSYRNSLCRGVCYRCHDELKLHDRCTDCTVLLHDESEHGYSPDGIRCQSCFDSRKRQTIHRYETDE